jgi:hypothetical protein
MRPERLAAGFRATSRKLTSYHSLRLYVRQSPSASVSRIFITFLSAERDELAGMSDDRVPHPISVCGFIATVSLK